MNATTTSIRRMILTGATAALMAIPFFAGPASALSLSAGPRQSRICTEVGGKGCETFRDDCKKAGKGITSTGAGDIAVLNCITIPPYPAP